MDRDCELIEGVPGRGLLYVMQDYVYENAHGMNPPCMPLHCIREDCTVTVRTRNMQSRQVRGNHNHLPDSGLVCELRFIARLCNRALNDRDASGDDIFTEEAERLYDPQPPLTRNAALQLMDQSRLDVPVHEPINVTTAWLLLQRRDAAHLRVATRSLVDGKQVRFYKDAVFHNNQCALLLSSFHTATSACTPMSLCMMQLLKCPFGYVLGLFAVSQQNDNINPVGYAILEGTRQDYLEACMRQISCLDPGLTAVPNIVASTHPALWNAVRQCLPQARITGHPFLFTQSVIEAAEEAGAVVRGQETAAQIKVALCMFGELPYMPPMDFTEVMSHIAEYATDHEINAIHAVHLVVQNLVYYELQREAVVNSDIMSLQISGLSEIVFLKMYEAVNRVAAFESLFHVYDGLRKFDAHFVSDRMALNLKLHLVKLTGIQNALQAGELEVEEYLPHLGEEVDFRFQRLLACLQQQNLQQQQAQGEVEVRQPYVVDRNIGENLLCIVCAEIERDTTLLPCRHFQMCEGCSRKVQLCPSCRSKIQDRRRTFL